jgi:hypothetical protein
MLFVAGLCHASLLSREDKSELLAGVDKLHAEDVSRILEKARKAVDRWEVTHSNFLPPPLLGDALTAVRRLSDVGVAISGGYSQVLSSCTLKYFLFCFSLMKC